MKVIIYGDFNCPYSYLASLRADRLIQRGTAEIIWRAVEHDRALPATGAPSAVDAASWEAEIAEVQALALRGEHAPVAAPPVISNTKAAVSAYAEAISDGIAGELRRRVFRAIWVAGHNLSSAYAVRRLVTDLMWQPSPAARLASPGLPNTLDHDPDLSRIVRRSGGTIAPDGGPLTTTAFLRIHRWRRQWAGLGQPSIPAVIGPDGIVFSGIEGLAYLAHLTGPGNGAPLPPRMPVGAGTAAAAG